MLRNCKFERDEDRYGHFPLTNRFGMDQVPLEIDRRNTTLEHQGSCGIYIRGAKKDLTKRLATLQVCVRVKGKQIMNPTIIFRNENPCEDSYEFPDGLKNRTVTHIRYRNRS